MTISYEQWGDKYSGELEDFDIDFSGRLGTDTIANVSQVTATVLQGDVTIVVVSFSGLRVKVWLSGGTPKTSAVIACTVHTVGGRTIEGRGFLRVA